MRRKRKSLVFHGLALDKKETEDKLAGRIQQILELKMNLKRRIGLKHIARVTDCSSNSPPIVVTFEDKVRT